MLHREWTRLFDRTLVGLVPLVGGADTNGPMVMRYWFDLGDRVATVEPDLSQESDTILAGSRSRRGARSWSI
jgi:hypothetical protein